jgi:hypothetical protein
MYYRKLHRLPLLTGIELRPRKLSLPGVGLASLPYNSQSSK